MWMSPRSGASGASLLSALSDVYNKSMVSADTSSIINSYLTWVGDSVRALRTVMRPEDLNRLILTPRYWATLSNPVSSPATNAAVSDEMLSRQAELRAATDDLRDAVARWQPPNAPRVIIVADTNVWLEHPQMFDQIDWHQLIQSEVRQFDAVAFVVPLLVVDELDDAKRDRVRSRARQNLKAVYDIFGDDPTTRRQLTVPPPPNRGFITIELLPDDPRRTRLPRPDDELVARSLDLQSLTGVPVNFISYDTGAVLRATTAGLTGHRLQRGV